MDEQPVQRAQLRRSQRLANRPGITQLNQRGKLIYNKQRLRKSAKKGPKKKTKLNINDTMKNITGIMLSQMTNVDKHAQVSVKKGIKRYGQKAIDAVLNEYAQLDNKTIFDPKKQESLTHQQKSNTLNLITMIKQK